MVRGDQFKEEPDDRPLAAAEKVHSRSDCFNVQLPLVLLVLLTYSQAVLLLTQVADIFVA